LCQHEHLLPAAAAADEPAGAVLRDQGVTPECIEAEMLRAVGRGQAADPLGGLDRQALAPSASTSMSSAPGLKRRSARTPWPGPSWLPANAGGPPGGRARWPSCRNAAAPAGPRGNAPLLPGPAPRGHIPFTPRAKKTLQLALSEAQALHDNHIGVQHLTLALLSRKDGTVPVILSALGAPATSLRASILARYREAS
jgi:hypothetical protein